MNTDTLHELQEYKSKLLTKINFLLEDLLSVSSERVKRVTNELIEELKIELKDLNKKISDLTSENVVSNKNEIINVNNEEDNVEEDNDDVVDDKDNDSGDSISEDGISEDEETNSETVEDDTDVVNNNAIADDGQGVYVGRKNNGDVVAIFNGEV